MNYYISYPLFIVCDLQCSYCWFKRLFYDTGKMGIIGITVDQYTTWRDTHLTDAENILVEFCGGETFMPQNLAVMEDFLDNTTVEKIDMLTNGVQPTPVYLGFINKYRDRIQRIGLSNHRSVMNAEQKQQFERNAIQIRETGVSVYIKELLIPDEIPAIRVDRQRWKGLGFVVKLQDFKGFGDKHHGRRGGMNDYVDIEYQRTVGGECSCRRHHKTIIIHSKWNPGDLHACWHDQVVVGNIIDNTYDPNCRTIKEMERMRVTGVPVVYNKQFMETEFNHRHTLGQ